MSDDMIDSEVMVEMTTPMTYTMMQIRLEMLIKEINTAFVDTTHNAEMEERRDFLIKKIAEFEHQHPEVLI